MAKYRCCHCQKIVERDSKKAWIVSYCEVTGRVVRLQRIVKYKGRHHKRATHA